VRVKLEMRVNKAGFFILRGTMKSYKTEINEVRCRDPDKSWSIPPSIPEEGP